MVRMAQDARKYVTATLQDHVTLVRGPVLMAVKMVGLEINAKVKDHKSAHIGIVTVPKLY